MFKDLKRKLNDIYQVLKFYTFKKVYNLIYDEDKDKYVKSECKAYREMGCTWEGDYDILNAMRLKVEHMIYNLKNYGMQADLYLDDYSYLRSIVDSSNKKNKKDCKLREFSLVDKKVTEYFHDFDNEIVPYPLTRDIVYAGIEYGYEDGEFKDAHISVRKDKNHQIKCLRHTLTLQSGKYKSGVPKKFYLSVVKVPKCKYSEKEFYYYSFSNQRNVLPEEDEEDINNHICSLEPERLSNLRVLIDNMKIENFWDIVERFQSLDFTPEDFKYMTDDFKKHLRGLRINLKELLVLRRKIRDLAITDSLDYNLKEYDKRRRNLYMEIADLMAKRGDNWWD